MFINYPTISVSNHVQPLRHDMFVQKKKDKKKKVYLWKRFYDSNINNTVSPLGVRLIKMMGDLYKCDNLFSSLTGTLLFTQYNCSAVLQVGSVEPMSCNPSHVGPISDQWLLP